MDHLLFASVMPLGQGLFFERLGVATAIGLCIGFERQWRQRTAGLHTTALVAIGAALFTAIPDLLGSSDTLRVTAQVVSGVGFLAGGVILRDGFNVRGLVTAATLWSTAAVGALAGTGLELQAFVGGATILAVNLFCLPLAAKIARIPRAAEELETAYTVHIRCNESARSAVRERVLAEIATTNLTLGTMTASVALNESLDLTVALTKPGRENGEADRLEASIEKIDGVTGVTWESIERRQ